VKRLPVGIIFIAILAGCGARTEVAAGSASRLGPGVKSLQSHVSPDNGGCGIENYPASRSAEQMVADAPRDGSSQDARMLARVAIDAQGKVTYLKVVRLAYTGNPNEVAINARAVDAIKGWRYTPTMMHGQPVGVCSDVVVTMESR
jgi:hypothetical protein